MGARPACLRSAAARSWWRRRSRRARPSRATRARRRSSNRPARSRSRCPWSMGGATMARIQGDPAGDSSLVAPTLGARVVHSLSPRLALHGDAEAMFFSHDVRAFGGRVGGRFEHVELAFRALDFNVGPALFGPELGVGF